jgi:hypothetical protein
MSACVDVRSEFDDVRWGITRLFRDAFNLERDDDFISRSTSLYIHCYTDILLSILLVTVTTNYYIRSTTPQSYKNMSLTIEQQVKCDSLVDQGRKALALSDWEQASEKYADALEIM